MLVLFIKGIILGFSIAAPIGPINILIIQRTFKAGYWAGLATSLGASTADMMYGLIAAFGLVGISQLLVGQEFVLHILGGVFLLYIGGKAMYGTKQIKFARDSQDMKSTTGLIKEYITAFLLTATSPVTILSFVAVFAGFGIGSEETHYLSAIILVLGVFLGSIIWTGGIMSTVSNHLRKRSAHTVITWIQYISGVALISIGLWVLITGFL